MRYNFFSIAVFSLGAFLSLCNVSYGRENKKTHPALTDRAVKATIDNYLKTRVTFGRDSGGVSLYSAR